METQRKDEKEKVKNFEGGRDGKFRERGKKKK